MKTLISTILAAAISIIALSAQAEEQDETVGEKASDAWHKTKETAKDVGQKTKETAKDVGHTLARKTKKAANTVADALTPDPDARRIDVNLSDRKIDMPTRLKPGKTAFVVHNLGKEKHSFQVRGNGTDQKFIASVSPNDTRVLHVQLKSGSYTVLCPMDNHAQSGMETKLTVR